MKPSALLLSAAIALGIATVGFAQPAPATEYAASFPDSSERAPVDTKHDHDLAYLMNSHHLSADEALRQLGTRERLTDVVTEHLEKLDGFAGIAVRYGQQLGFDAYASTDRAATGILGLMESVGLAEYTELHLVRYSLADLESARVAILKVDGYPRHDTYSEIGTNRLVVAVAKDDYELALDRLPNDLEDRVDVRAEGLAMSSAGGGTAFIECTSGFTVAVISTPTKRGISTAGHCQNAQTYNGTGLYFEHEERTHSHDMQWHSQGSITWTNTIYDNQYDTTTPYYRFIESRETRSNMLNGDPVCKYGVAGGYDCAEIVHTNFCPNYIVDCSPTFGLAWKSGVDMGTAGDSGGPVFYGQRAFGLVSGRGSPDGTALIFMPQEYLNDMGVKVAVG